MTPTLFSHYHPRSCGGKEQNQRTNKRIENQIKISPRTEKGGTIKESK